jgi:hypothetical protein
VSEELVLGSGTTSEHNFILGHLALEKREENFYEAHNTIYVTVFSVHSWR